ncbi:MAG: DUF3945 domain-containing protein [Cyclobacteriaceae bacterium]
MHISDIPSKKPLADISEVPDHVNGCHLSLTQKQVFANGELLFLENMRLQDGRIVDGKVKLVKDEKGEFTIPVFEKKEILEIPEQILSYKLSLKDKEDLMAEKAVAIKIPSGQTLFLQIDKDLNRVMIQTERDLSMISEVGKYKLTEKDKLAWVNGVKLPTRIFYEEKTGTYFAASIRKSEDGKGIEYHNYKSLKDLHPDKLKDLIKEVNYGPDVITATSSVTQSIKTDKAPISEHVTNKHSTKEIDTTHDNDRRFVEYTNNKDYEGLKRLAQEGYKPEKDIIDRTTAQLNLTTSEKKAIMSAVGNQTQKNIPVVQEKDHVILSLNNKPYKVLEFSENGTKALLIDSQHKKIGVSVEHIRLMSKKEKGMYIASEKKRTQENSIQI